MSNKQAATYHGVPCSGECDRNPHGTCYHGRACAYHLAQDAEQSRRDWAAEFQAELRESEVQSKRMEGWSPWR